jgi:squalene synthase HpnC
MTATAAPEARFVAPTKDAVMAQAASENFPVALRLLGATKRRQLLSLYGYARLVDDAGDEASGDRLGLLDWIEADLDRIYAHERPEHPVLQALQPTIDALGLPDDPLRRLIEANRRDQTVHDYPSFDALLDYCTLSAAPVGELVLHVFGAATPERIALSDRICAGLQVTEHLQDVAEDNASGRVYLPADDRRRFGIGAIPATTTAEFRDLIAFEVARAHLLLRDGAPLIRTLRGASALAVAGFVAGGRAALDAIAAAGYDVLAARPRPTRRRFGITVLTTIWRRG